VVAELLIVYDANMNQAASEWFGPEKVLDINSTVKDFKLIMGGQAIGWSTSDTLSIQKICSYSEYFDGTSCVKCPDK
jgi:hypothetical protein